MCDEPPTSSNIDDYVDFSDAVADAPEIKKKEGCDTLYGRDGGLIKYDDKTIHYYKTLRERKMDPILLSEIDDKISFKFFEEWNPYTGERLLKDPYGPLYFHPDTLIRYFYVNRLNDLWVPESEQDGIFYEGMYDVAVGAGFDIYIQSRGYNPEKYLFRLPIDCYWLRCIDGSNVTMGPILTDQEIKQIDELAKKCGHSYYYQYKAERPNLYEIKKFYDRAINKKPAIITTAGMTPMQISEAYMKANRLAVDKLRTMKG
ncbi:MAG: hypothetical protein Harvfovirus8_8 [Harvfovirus sp.]|uniref:Uncharacterized protein n=1 Tax=Harvfovirus sp. TaxID=2487768 RepID=A0A3G5A0X1_9VIRU|nr:MAG: hypothetical protein Harvfovirus8_8 [Harvfovirus sp.]